MSWNSYTDSLKASLIEYAAIIGTVDGGIWATTEDRLLPQEGQNIAQAFNDDTNMKGQGIWVGSRKYMFLRHDGDTIIGKLGGENGVVLCKGPQCILIGVYDKRLQPGQASQIVHKMSDYLKDAGY